MSTLFAITRQHISIMLISGLILTSIAYAADKEPFWFQFGEHMLAERQ